jgi:ribose 5-phosphate isomerase A
VVDAGGPLSFDQMKRAAAEAAVAFVEPGAVIGVGSGTTAWAFVEALAESSVRIEGAIAASFETARLLTSHDIPVLKLSAGVRPTVYIDGADAVDGRGAAIKGGGGAHTREKAIASVSEYWVGVVDATKIVRTLGGLAIPVEVKHGAVESASEALVAMGATVSIRRGLLTDEGNPVLDALGLPISDGLALEDALDAIPGAVGNGLFAHRRIDLVLVGRAAGGVGRIVPHAEGCW